MSKGKFERKRNLKIIRRIRSKGINKKKRKSG